MTRWGSVELLANVVLKVLKLAIGAAYTIFLKHKLAEWYAAAPKSDWHAPAQMENDGEVSEAGEEREEGAGDVGLLCSCETYPCTLYLH